MSFVTGALRAAAVAADSMTTLLGLDPEDVADLATRTNQLVAQRLAKRLEYTS